MLGLTPIHALRIPRSLLQFQIEKAGYVPVEDVGLLPRYLTLARLGPEQPHTYVLETQAEQPPGMVRVSPRGPQLLAIAGLEHVKPFELGDFWIDRLEVTNRAYKAFVDAGGYSERRFWTNPFIKAGKTTAWEEAMSGFHDSTGRPGPSTWELGTYPEGQDEFPVGGVSWYEAAAYSEFAGKSLPTIFHWSVVADRRATSSVLCPVVDSPARGCSPSAGQARSAATDARSCRQPERVVSERGGRRPALHARRRLNDPTYFFNDADGRSPWDRSPALGFRSMKVVDPAATSELALRAPAPFFFRDFSRERPVSDDVFRAYSALYSYDHTDLGGWYDRAMTPPGTGGTRSSSSAPLTAASA